MSVPCGQFRFKILPTPLESFSRSPSFRFRLLLRFLPLTSPFSFNFLPFSFGFFATFFLPQLCVGFISPFFFFLLATCFVSVPSEARPRCHFIGQTCTLFSNCSALRRLDFPTAAPTFFSLSPTAHFAARPTATLATQSGYSIVWRSLIALP